MLIPPEALQSQQPQQDPQDPTAERLRQAMMASMLSATPQDQSAAPVSTGMAPTAPTSIVDAPQPPTSLPPDTSKPATLPDNPQPDVTLAHASMGDQPASKWVDQAQQKYDQFEHTPMWKRMLVPALIGATTAIGAHSRNGAALAAEGQQDIQGYGAALRNKRDTLQSQLQSARTMQQQEYELDQRNRQQDLITAANNQQRSLTSQLLAQSRQGVAQTQADSRRDVADTTADSRRDVADTGANSRVTAAKYMADSAMTRLIYGQGREDQRQARGIGATQGRLDQQEDFSLDKPTADEDRRADMSQALIGYTEMLRDIATRRPELFGNLSSTAGGLLTGKLQGGRMTALRQLAGTDDPDVKNLKFLKEQLGIVQMTAHSMRSAQAIAPIADSLVNGFNDSSSALLNTIDLAQKGVHDAFLGPQVRPPVATSGRTPLTRRVQQPATAQPQSPTHNQQSIPLNATTAAAILQEAGGDKVKARQLATARGYQF